MGVTNTSTHQSVTAFNNSLTLLTDGRRKQTWNSATIISYYLFFFARGGEVNKGAPKEGAGGFRIRNLVWQDEVFLVLMNCVPHRIRDKT